ncbi:aldehyde dehydrogenase family 8 member A1 [Basidiobolus meristosporus CBS 931.73]|uniref:Aldehyde dehydrogenase family 8 member A1 n=1 Tax=Basidiobolus meristosporus CBS 931.73 TaxID=1314790 RepID=A0A1Y1Z3S8_9FUNG|nr:aldehyde dehydrogenase family 8 member A1 [Basidiobolus meristosporus CBS 931.73]|eukprot:ORY04913.1 aldehyde dehydrogenase family 8 member A1 [Basidiobolus meristosporus CBS 931.73]
MVLDNSFRINNFINGQYVAPRLGEYIDNFNPSTGEVYSYVANSSEEDVNAAVAAASDAFPIWSSRPRQERSQILLRIADLLEAKAELFGAAESKDQGKPVAMAVHNDVPKSAAMFRYFASLITHTKETVSLMDGVSLSYTQRMPAGVCALVSPWNFPLYLLVWKIAPCLAAGCTAVCKPSEFTSVTAHMLCEVMQEAGLPDGVCNMVFGTGSRTGSVLIEHPDVAAISFTGGCETGRKINDAAGRGFKKASLELGGKNANIVFADVNLQSCVPVSVKSAFLNQGEICLCNSRMFVHRSIYDEFLKLFIEETQRLVVGDPSKKDTFMGPVVNKAQYDKIIYYIKLAEEEGGKIECGGIEKPETIQGTELEGGYFIKPTVITGLSPQSRVMQEEIFGPVVAICPFDEEEEVIKLANGTRYGLSASVWSLNGQRARRVAEKLRTGNVWINTWMVRDMAMPFGGIKASGLGREGGEHAINFFTDYKSIMLAN